MESLASDFRHKGAWHLTSGLLRQVPQICSTNLWAPELLGWHRRPTWAAIILNTVLTRNRKKNWSRHAQDRVGIIVWWYLTSKVENSPLVGLLDEDILTRSTFPINISHPDRVRLDGHDVKTVHPASIYSFKCQPDTHPQPRNGTVKWPHHAEGEGTRVKLRFESASTLECLQATLHTAVRIFAFSHKPGISSAHSEPWRAFPHS